MSGGASVAETTGNQGQMAAALNQGLNAIDLNQTVTFTLYRRLVLPADGFVFWVRADLVAPAALPAGQTAPALNFQAQGSLHHTTINNQDPDESFSNHRMTFTAKQPVNDLSATLPDMMYLAETDGERYAFSTRSMWYRQAGLYHYSGDAVYPALASQIINSAEELNLRDVVVSNSLPIWLGFNQLFPIYPSLLVPDNLYPPYGVVNIDEEDTSPIQANPIIDSTGSRWQLVRDRVRIVTYGIRNDDISDWIAMVQDYALAHPNIIGVMNSPIAKDAKRGQVEINTIAQKKSIIFEVNYYQARIRDVARQLITRAFISEIIPSLGVSV